MFVEATLIRRRHTPNTNIIWQYEILVYADNIIMLGTDGKEVKNGTKELIINSKDIEL